MSAVVKIKLWNNTVLPGVRFIGVHFDGSTFASDVNAGGKDSVTHVHNGSISLTAFRTSDQQALDTLTYPVSDTLGFAAVLTFDKNDPLEPYKLVGEPFVITTP